VTAPQASPTAGRACCCPALPVVRVVMPATPARPHPTDLLLCGHHYRMSRRTPAAMNATVHKLWEVPGDMPVLSDPMRRTLRRRSHDALRLAGAPLDLSAGMGARLTGGQRWQMAATG
jgi:hypothetical protein